MLAMASENQLIIIKGEDKTDEIKHLSIQGNTILVTYKSNKKYPYNKSNVQVYQPKEIFLPQNTIVLVNGKQVREFSKCVLYQNHARVFHGYGKPKLHPRHSVKIIHSCLQEKKTSDCFNYLKQIANAIGLHGKDGGNILANKYEKVTFIREDGVLGSFLRGQFNRTFLPSAKTALYPFGFNASQKQAVENAMSSQLSIIEGPPGTGKTQTILNIIANAIMNNESVAVVSSNDSATRNVFEKLKNNKVDFVAAYLGKADNKKAFIKNQTHVPNMGHWLISPSNRFALQQQMATLFASLQMMLEKRNELAKLKDELESMQIEYAHFKEYCEETYGRITILPMTRRVFSRSTLTLWLTLQGYQETQTKIGLWQKLMIFFRFGIWGSDFFHQPLEQSIASCQIRYYEERIRDLGEATHSVENELGDYGFDQKMQHYSELSMQVFKDFLARRYEGNKCQLYQIDDLWKNSEDFINDYPVVLSTTYSLRSSLNPQFVYDYVIVDEASQVDLATGALALSCASKAVIVGDLKQLPNVVDSDQEKLTDAIFLSSGLPEQYRYSNHSLLSSLTQLFPTIPKVLLREHYRCHPMIIGFCNQKFYGSELIILTEAKDERPPLAVYRTAKGNHARDRVNQRQIDMIKQEIIPQLGLGQNGDTIGIVTPYRNQTNALQKEFYGMGIMADTVDKFQGQERDIIILSTVDNEVSKFTDNPNRLNVAVSRAIKQLILVVNGNDGESGSVPDTNIGDLIKYIEYNNLTVIDSKVYSIFDYLFKAYNVERAAFLKGKRRISEYDSENLMFVLLSDILRQDRFCNYDVGIRVPLKMVIRDFSLLGDAETQYAMNSWTHLDFLVFNKIGRTPALAIEVDGVSFHSVGSRQFERDKMKDEILKKYGIPVLRCRTNESGEKERIESTLAAISS
jgi:very-short-patch-repair endonuclease/KaiC/GvpD/RAD55 family RecA-like ATPase